MSLRPVMLVSYYFPPHGGAGTQRFAKFAKWLPSFGYRPVVVAADEGMQLESAPTSDASLAQEVGELTRVHRLAPRARHEMSIRERALLALRFRVDEEEWADAAIPVCDSVGRAEGVVAVVTTTSPFACWRIGEEVRGRLGIPWILDLRDPWTLDGWRTFPTAVHALHDFGVMRRALRSADMVVANTPRARDAFVERAGVKPDRVVTIPNGFDPDDFPSGVAERSHGRFRLVHVGTLHSVDPEVRRGIRARLRSSLVRIDETARSGRYLFEAIAQLKRGHPDLYSLLRVELIGRVHPSHRRLAATLGISEAVVERGYLEHRHAVAEMCAADAVFVPLHGMKSPGPELIVPGKLYEALASGAHVLGCVAEGDAARLIRSVRGGSVCGPSAVDCMTEQLVKLLNSYQSGASTRGAERSDMMPFTRESLTRRLAGVLDAVNEGVPAPLDDPWDQVEQARRTASVPVGVGAG